MNFKEFLKCLIKYLVFTIHPILSLIALIFLTSEVILKRSYILILEYLFLITTLSVGNNKFFKIFDSYEKIKFILIGIIFIKLIFRISENYNICYIKNFIKFEFIYKLWVGYIFYFLITSFYFSSYFEISLSKLVYYFIGQTICYILIKNIEIEDLNKKIFQYLLIMLFLNIVVALTNLGYVRTLIGFQGIYGNPNGLGIVLTIFYATLLGMYRGDFKKNLSTRYFIIINIIILIFLKFTNSRTSLIAAFICLILYIFTKDKKITKNILYSCIGAVILLLSGIIFESSINKVIYKGNKNILYSREKQIEKNLIRFKENPYFGKGFAVENQKRSDEYLVVEKGNTILQILSDGGMCGLVLFIMICLYILKKSNNSNKIIFVSIFLTNMGEATLLSFNGIGTFNILLLYYITKK